MSTISSTGSRVVPARSFTTERCACASWLSSDDLPTFGRPTSATRRRWDGVRNPDVRSALFNASIAASSRSPTPLPCIAEIGYGSPNPSFQNSAAMYSLIWSSTLFTATMTGLPAARSMRTMRSSVVVRPTWPSTTNTTASASSTAICACDAIADSMPSTSASQPPVSTSLKSVPAHSAS